VVVAAGVSLLLTFPVAARLAADAQPIHPAVVVPVLSPVTGTGYGVLAALPRFSSPAARAVLAYASTPAAVRSDFFALARPLLGAPAAATLWRVVTDPGYPFLSEQATMESAISEPVYPFRYPRLAPILSHWPTRPTPTQIAQANDLGALLTVAAARFPIGRDVRNPGPFPSAAAVAYALLDRARAGGACAPQENLAFLVAADHSPRDVPAGAEFRRAEVDCPGDPTPLWLQGQFESQRAVVDRASFSYAAGPAVSPAYRLTEPLITFSRLERLFPRSAAGWAGEADTDMRIGYQIQATEPFGARQLFARALALYRRAERLQPGSDLLHGAARALAALGNTDAAVGVERQAAARAAVPGPFASWLIEYLERDGRFTAAAALAAALMGHRIAFQPALYPVVPGTLTADTDPIVSEDLADPISLGTGELKPVTLFVGPAPAGAGAYVSDLSFIPIYRPVTGLGGDSRWCPDWDWRLDLLLSGQPRATQAGFPARGTFTDIRTGGPCFANTAAPNGGTHMLAALAELELGDISGARRVAPVTNSAFGITLSELEDLHQNVWRYAGEFARADAATTQWATLIPGDPLAMIRKGEIAFLRGRYEDAVLAFQAAVRRARGSSGLWSRNEAQALLDEGAALAREGRRTDALSAFSMADSTATSWLAVNAAAKSGDPSAIAWSPYISYNAWAQTGDAELAAGDYERATEAYRAASDYLRAVMQTPPVPMVQPGVLENNRAIAELKNGSPAVAVSLAAFAVATDPTNPIYHSTEAWALQRQGRWSPAVAEYRTAVALDPTEYPAENDLAVLLMQNHRYAEAATILRRAVGANEDYAKGWFNLGVALSHLGPLRLLASQGSYGTATRLDSSLAQHPPSPMLDDVPYATNLDVSKPLPAHWTFADRQRTAPIAAAGFAAILALALGLARALLPARLPGGADRWLGMLNSWTRRARSVAVLRRWPLAVAITVAVFVWPVRAQPEGGWLWVGLFVAGLLLLILLAGSARALAARPTGLRFSQESWAPGLVLGVCTMLAGLAWAPLPVAQSTAPDDEQPSSADAGDDGDETPMVPADVINLHWAAPAALGAIALAQLLLAAWLDVPLTRSLGAAGLVMTASLLTPIKPVDGGTIAITPPGAVTILAVAGTAGLVALGVL